MVPQARGRVNCIFMSGTQERHDVSSNKNQFVVTGLAPDTSYQVSLWAVSRLGVGHAVIDHATTRALHSVFSVTYVCKFGVITEVFRIYFNILYHIWKQENPTVARFLVSLCVNLKSCEPILRNLEQV